MSIYDKASLVLIPSGTKTSKVYSQKPVNGDGDFTFSRSTAATRVNADGNIEKETQNLLTYSNTFDNAVWTHSGIALTSGQAGYDGTNNAWELNKGAAAYVSLYQAISNSNVVTGSFYVKAGTLTTAALYSSTTTTPNAFAHFDLTDGSLLSSAGIVSASSEDVGNGWWRLSIVVSKGVFNLRIYPDWSGSTAGTIYVQDAQLEQGLVARDVITTTTAAVEGGITDNVPRLDYTDSSCPALLLEPQRTNLFTQSEYLNGFTTSGSPAPTLTANYAESPEGLDNAYRVEIPSVSGLALMAQLVSHTSGTDMTISAYVKSNVASNQSFKLFGDYGTASGTSGTLTATSEWQRFTFTFTPTATGSRNAGILNVANTAADLVVYAMQVEAGSYATSYIPTYGTSVTRNDETCTDAIANTSGDYWTLFIDYANYSNGSLSGDDSMVFRDSSNVTIFALWGLSNGFVIRSFSGDSNGGYYTSNSFGKTAKAIVRYDGSEIGLFVDGVKQTITSHSPLETNWNQLYKVHLLRASDNKYNVNELLIFPTALTDQEAIDLTTI